MARVLAFLFCLAQAGCLASPPRTPGPTSEIRLSPEQASEIGKRIWLNEGGGKDEFLTWWNKGEEFASIGIGHFLWYPRGYRGPFTESFPQLLDFLERNGVPLPVWLKDKPPCPWATREEFMKDQQSPRLQELRLLLKDTIALQAAFEARRLEAALPKMLESVAPDKRNAVRRQFFRVAQAPLGLYALMDYVNFKGEGTSSTERYKGLGWGLLQVLEGLSGDEPGRPAIEEFIRSAEAVLASRVENSPPERNEARWLPVWRRRLQTYLP